jgi:hypothetical protein
MAKVQSLKIMDIENIGSVRGSPVKALQGKRSGNGKKWVPVAKE